MIRRLLVAAAVAGVIAGVAAGMAPAASAEPYYANCGEVCAAGKAPLHKGDPGYRPGLDKDGDGIACEVCP